MARIRSLHPGFFTDEATVSVSFAARLLLIGIWNESDDHGIFEWKPVTLKMRLMPVDNVDIPALLEELIGSDAIKRFSAGGKEYGAVRNFCKYQRPKKPVYVHELPDELNEFVAFEADSAEFELRKRKHADQNGQCYYCRTDITYYRKRLNSLELDHVVARSKGGSDDESNLAATCRTCNRAKGATSESEFREWLAKNHSRNGFHCDSGAISEQTPRMKEEGGNRKGNMKEEGSERRAPAPEPALSDQDRAVCTEHGIPIDRIEAEMANCRAWHAANGKPIRDWPATWRVWCLRHAQNFASKPRPVAATAAPATVGIVPGSEHWDAWEGHYRVIQAKFRLTCMAEAANEGKPYMVPSLWPSGHPGASPPAADLDIPERKKA